MTKVKNLGEDFTQRFRVREFLEGFMQKALHKQNAQQELPKSFIWLDIPKRPSKEFTQVNLLKSFPKGIHEGVSQMFSLRWKHEEILELFSPKNSWKKTRKPRQGGYTHKYISTMMMQNETLANIVYDEVIIYYHVLSTQYHKHWPCGALISINQVPHDSLLGHPFHVSWLVIDFRNNVLYMQKER